MIRSYCINGLKDIELFPLLERVQFTLNGHVSPQKRKTVEALQKLHFPTTDVFVHYDFLRTIPRYLIMTPFGKEQMVSEITDLIKYSFKNNRVKGVVIHMDTCFKKEMIQDLVACNYDESSIEGICKKHILSGMYITASEVSSLIKRILSKLTGTGFKSKTQEFLHLWYQMSVDMFYVELMNSLLSKEVDIFSSEEHARVFLENTTHVYSNGLDMEKDLVAGSVRHISLSTLGKEHLFGVCWDTEHAFASNDICIDQKNLVEVYTMNKNLYVHLNCVEKGVKRGSMKDRHSMTTIYDCDHYELDYYLELIAALDKLKIPYMREVKSETMEKELNLQSKIS